MGLFVLIVVIAAAAAAGVWRFCRTSGTPIQRVLEAMVPASVVGLAFLLLSRIALGTDSDWNDAKLAPVAAMTRGYQLYQDPTTGVMTGWIYGPVGAILLLPAALARDPTTAIHIGVTITAAAYLAPVAWLLAMASRGQARGPALIGFVLFGWLAIAVEDLARCLLIVGPDGLALGLATCACAAMYRRRTLATMSVSALAAVLCVWTKQNFLPLLVALVIYVALVDGLKTAGVFTAILVALGAVISAILIGSFGASNMYFHMVSLPASHPLKYPEMNRFRLMLVALADLLATMTWGLAVLLFMLVVDSLAGRRTAGGLRGWAIARPWSILVIVAVLFIPSSILGYIKVGGFLNNLAATHTFVLLAGLAGGVEACRQPSDYAEIVAAGLTRAVFTVYGLMLAVVCLLVPLNTVAAGWRAIVDPYSNTANVIFEYARKHPGDIYCPWNPLATLLAEGKLYHFEWGMLDRIHAGKPPSEAQFTAHVSPEMTKVVYAREPQSLTVLKAMVEYRRRVEVPDLPGCHVIVREPSGPR